MAINFTDRQKEVLDARNHNILVSAAAGSGKTAVLVERIVRMISEGDHPLDIDRLLVVTFTRAAAAQMRERIGKAISDRLKEDPQNGHLQRQEMLLHNAQITTIDSFCTFLLRNNFSEIDLDPGFRQMDETERALLEGEVMQDFLEKKYGENDRDFLSCAEYFCPRGSDKGLEDLIHSLYARSTSHPQPEKWLRERALDYEIHDTETLFGQIWMQAGLLQALQRLLESEKQYDAMIRMSLQPDGPTPYADFLETERSQIFEPLHKGRAGEVLDSMAEGTGSLMPYAGTLSSEDAKILWSAVCRTCVHNFARIPNCGKKAYPLVDEEVQKAVKSMRDAQKDMIQKLNKHYSHNTPEVIVAMMERVSPFLKTLAELTLEFTEAFALAKKEKNAIDFSDLEHYALQILVDPHEDGTYSARPCAVEYRQHFDEILIDEYQDSNDVQELLLSVISREAQGRYNRFMVGDVKQSIYKFRLARPEIFMEKFDTYRHKDPQTERIDLDQNFRSRTEVLDFVNQIFYRIMRREIGGVEYNEEVSLKPGMPYPEAGEDTYRPELLLVDDAFEPEEEEEQEPPAQGLTEEEEELSSRRREALAIAARIREMVGRFPLKDEETGGLRPASYGDMVVLLRSSAGWNEEFRDVFEKEGIPSYVDSRAGYFSAQEIRTILQLLRVLDNPRQDIPLYGVMHSYFGGFTEEDLARIRLDRQDRILYESLLEYTGREEKDELSERLGKFMTFLEIWREKSLYMPVHELLSGLLDQTGYADYCRALPGGRQRVANLRMLETQASNFEQTAFTGLFQFIRYIDQMHRYEVDYGEANILDEHADVVRIMTIHKSKGLEFPVCFVAGLSKGYSFKRHDASGSLVCDTDWGIGIDYVDPEGRLKASTLRKDMIADKIKRDSLGEELRVLYVAMTRAKEKLILTAHSKDMAKTVEKCGQKLKGLDRSFHLPDSVIMDSSCFLDLILEAMMVTDGPGRDILETGSSLADVRRIGTASMRLSGLGEQTRLAEREMALEAAAQEERGEEDPAEKEIRRRLSASYPHPELEGLYTKVSVSELKMAAIHGTHAGAGEEEAGEGEKALFPDPPKAVIPSFARTGDAEDEKSSGTGYGTAVHRLMELWDYKRFPDPDALTEDTVLAWRQDTAEAGLIPPEDAALVSPRLILGFLQSSLGRRMARAAGKGLLFREQPFVLGLPASAMDPVYPDTETVLIQGIIDAFFEEEGQIVLVDYKTDRVEKGEELSDRYRVQMEYYSTAIERMTHRKVSERILYSFRLRCEVHV